MRLVERRRLDTHVVIVLTVCAVQAAVCLFGVSAIIALAWTGKPIPELLAGFVGGALTGLPSLLAQTRSGAQDTHIVNPPSDPVQTENVEKKDE